MRSQRSNKRDLANPYASPTVQAAPESIRLHRISWTVLVIYGVGAASFLIAIQIIFGWIACLMTVVTMVGSGLLLLSIRTDLTYLIVTFAAAVVLGIWFAFKVDFAAGMLNLYLLGLSATAVWRWLYPLRHARRAAQLFVRGAMDEAIEEWGRAIAANPQDSAAYSNRGMALLQIGRNDAAFDDMNAAIALRDDVAIYYLNRGAVLERMNRLDDALEDYQRAVVLDPACTAAMARATELLAKQDAEHNVNRGGPDQPSRSDQLDDA